MYYQTGIVIVILLLLGACVKKPVFPEENIASQNEYKGILVLNEGLWQQNNSTLTYYNPVTQEIKKNVFFSINNQILGDTANDMVKIADTLFIVVSTSNTIYKLNAKTLKILQTLIISNGGDLRKMAYINPQKAYVSALTGQKVWIINPSTMQVLTSFSASFPEEIKFVQNKLYITQSNYPPNFKNKNLVVWNILTDTKIKEIPLPVENATHLAIDNTQNLWVSCTGDYINPVSAICKINTSTDTIEQHIPFSNNPTHIRTVQDTVYVMNDTGILWYYQGLTAPQIWIKKEEFTEFGEVFYNFYFDEVLQKWFIATSRQFIYDGRILILDKKGNLQYSFFSGLNPSVMIHN
jgi:DNA-binding beta-propeller fold protein YncE